MNNLSDKVIGATLKELMKLNPTERTPTIPLGSRLQVVCCIALHRAFIAHASTSASASNNVWFVDSGASNHMTSHEDWFQELHAPERPGYVEIGDDMTHPIQHIGNVPFGNNGHQTYLKNVLHVPTITKNLSSVG